MSGMQRLFVSSIYLFSFPGLIFLAQYLKNIYPYFFGSIIFFCGVIFFTFAKYSSSKKKIEKILLLNICSSQSGCHGAPPY